MARFRVHRGLPPSAFVELAHRPVQLRLRGHGGRWPLAPSARRGLIGAATWDMAINSLFISTQASELKFMHARKWSSDSNGLPCWNRLRYAAATARSAAADALPGLLLPPQVDRNGLPVPHRDLQESSRALFTHRVGSSPHRLDANPRVLCASDSASSSFPP